MGFETFFFSASQAQAPETSAASQPPPNDLKLLMDNVGNFNQKLAELEAKCLFRSDAQMIEGRLVCYINEQLNLRLVGEMTGKGLDPHISTSGREKPVERKPLRPRLILHRRGAASSTSSTSESKFDPKALPLETTGDEAKVDEVELHLPVGSASNGSEQAKEDIDQFAQDRLKALEVLAEQASGHGQEAHQKVDAVLPRLDELEQRVNVAAAVLPRLDELEERIGEGAKLSEHVEMLETVSRERPDMLKRMNVLENLTGRLDKLQEIVTHMSDIERRSPARRRHAAACPAGHENKAVQTPLLMADGNFKHSFSSTDGATSAYGTSLFNGTWVDRNSTFYDGSAILITDLTWKPLHPRNPAQKNATYSMIHVSGEEKELVETREDETERHFKLQLSLDDTLTVQLIPSQSGQTPLTWTLMRDDRRLTTKAGIRELLHARSMENMQSASLPMHTSFFRHYAHAVVSSTIFEYFVGLIIIMNCILIGWEIEVAIQGEDTWGLQLLEIIFLAFYICELILRAVAMGSHGSWYRLSKNTMRMEDYWFFFDVVVVLIGVLSVILSGMFQEVMVIRVCRLARLCRAARMFKFVEPLWKLVRGLQSALDTLLWTFVIIVGLLYIFACFGGEIVAQNPTLLEDELARTVVTTNFNSLGVIMLTLVQFTTGDTTPVYFDVINADPWMAMYFVPCFLFVTILLMNLVTAALVNDAINQGKEDTEMNAKRLKNKVAQYVPELEHIFDYLDKDATGDITMKELARFTPNADVFGYELSDEVKDILKPENLSDMYECFDADSSGTVSREEFVQGGLAVLTKDVPMEITQLLQLVRNNAFQLKIVGDKIDKLENEI